MYVCCYTFLNAKKAGKCRLFLSTSWAFAAGRIQTQSGSFRVGVVFIKNPDVDPVWIWYHLYFVQKAKLVFLKPKSQNSLIIFSNNISEGSRLASHHFCRSFSPLPTRHWVLAVTEASDGKSSETDAAAKPSGVFWCCHDSVSTKVAQCLPTHTPSTLYLFTNSNTKNNQLLHSAKLLQLSCSQLLKRWHQNNNETRVPAQQPKTTTGFALENQQNSQRTTAPSSPALDEATWLLQFHGWEHFKLV